MSESSPWLLLWEGVFCCLLDVFEPCVQLKETPFYFHTQRGDVKPDLPPPPRSVDLLCMEFISEALFLTCTSNKE